MLWLRVDENVVDDDAALFIVRRTQISILSTSFETPKNFRPPSFRSPLFAKRIMMLLLNAPLSLDAAASSEENDNKNRVPI